MPLNLQELNLKEQMQSLGVASAEADKIIAELKALQEKMLKPEEIWWRLVNHILINKAPHYYPFALHLLLYKTIYPNWNNLPAPAWFPREMSQEYKKPTESRDKNHEEINLLTFMQTRGFKNYTELHHWSIQEREDFWQEITNTLGIVFDKAPEKTVDYSAGLQNPNWFPGATMNIASSCFTAKKTDIAIIEGDEAGKVKYYTYKELDELSNQIAENLTEMIPKSQAVAIIMPMHFYAVAIYLGIIKAGGVVVSIAESFSANEITTRLKIANCSIVFTQDEILRDGKKLPLLEKIIAPNLQVIRLSVFVDFLQAKTKSKSKTATACMAIPCKPMDPINILFSSGTTSEPKAIPWNHTTAIKSASDAYFHQNIQPGDKLCWPSSIGWMMGPWEIFASLINKATLAIFTGNPNSHQFGEFIAREQITILGLVPTLVKHWRETKCMENLNWHCIKLFTSTGECSNVEDMFYLMYLAGYKPIIEYCGGTEIGGAYITSTIIQPSAPAAFSAKAMGSDFLLLDESGKPSNKGEVALIPGSMGLSSRLLNADHLSIYFANMPKLADGTLLRRHGDQAEYYPNSYYRLLGRVDDTMNLGGIKVSSAELERVLNCHPEVLETAAVAKVSSVAGPEELMVFVVLKQKPEDSNTFKHGSLQGKDNSNTAEKETCERLKKELQQLIKDRLNPLFKIQEIILIEKLPRTASNKVMRRILRAEYRKL